VCLVSSSVFPKIRRVFCFAMWISATLMWVGVSPWSFWRAENSRFTMSPGVLIMVNNLAHGEIWVSRSSCLNKLDPQAFEPGKKHNIKKTSHTIVQ
jgi:hypothetical protein